MGAEQQAIWLWRSDDDLWELFDANDTAKINAAISRGEDGMVLERHGSFPKTYFIDFLRQTQTNIETGCQRRVVEVKPNSEWLRNTSHNRRETTWEKIPQRDALEMEHALFARQDSTILERGADVYYVDFVKWTQTNLTTGSTFPITVKPDQVLGLGHRRDSSSSHSNMSGTSAMTNNSSSSGQQQPQHLSCTHHHDRQPLHRPTSPHTVTDYHPHHYHDAEEMVPFGAPVNESAKSRRFMNPQESESSGIVVVTAKSRCAKCSRRHEAMGKSNNYTTSNTSSDTSLPTTNTAMSKSSSDKKKDVRYVWHWRNDYGSWDLYDTQVIRKIEEALQSGEDSMMFMRESAPYFLDLVNLTQTNVSTGCTREIRRIPRATAS